MTDRELLEQLLKVLSEAAEDIESWGGYASDYFKNKHDLAGDVRRYRDAVEEIHTRLAEHNSIEPVARVFRNYVGGGYVETIKRGAVIPEGTVLYMMNKEVKDD